jgi:arylamine N-acetyltransferase
LQTILKDIGFQVTPILSDDLYMSSHLAKEKRPKHCAMIVTIEDEQYLVDSAFGGIGLLSPIKLEYKATKQFSEQFQIIKTNEYSYVLQFYRKEQWTSLYGFENKAATLKSHRALMAKNANPLNKDSLFKTFFACTKPFHVESNNGRIILADETLTIIEDNVKVSKEAITSQEQLHDVLQDQFNIDVKNRFLRFTQVDMLAYQKGITHPPSNHRYPTRLKEKYEQLTSESYTKNDEKAKNPPPSPRPGRKFQI